jgi:hypothetical protein
MKFKDSLLSLLVMILWIVLFCTSGVVVMWFLHLIIACFRNIF